MKTLLDLKEREYRHMMKQTVGSEEYVESSKRLLDIEKRISEISKSDAEVVSKQQEVELKRQETELKKQETVIRQQEVELKKQEATVERKDRITKNVIEAVKIGAGTIALPLIGLVWITATEKDSTFTGVLREYTKYFFPKK